jgi:predicted DNA repair protein MutK
MAASSLIALIDDIASVLDDVAVLSKAAAHRTVGVLGDDLALNAQQVTGVSADRELPVVWAVAKGSFVNKAILVPLALAISAYAPWAVTPLLMVGGAFLCYEGFEKLAHRFLHSRSEDDAHRVELNQALLNPKLDLVAFERAKIKGAVRTDFILSAEIIAITLGTVAGSPLWTQVAVLSTIAVLMTAGVYGFVAGIVKLDDLGLYLCRRRSALSAGVGGAILKAAPWLMKGLSIAGTLAMFLVGGGILVHGFPILHHAIEGWSQGVGGPVQAVLPTLLNALIGVVAGALVLAGVSAVRGLVPAPKSGAVHE